MADRLFGIETEYAVSAVGTRGMRADQSALLDALMGRARAGLPHLSDAHARGIFLQNGARFYVDAGGHPEFTTPECTTPAEVVRFVRAGEAILLRLTGGAPLVPMSETAIYRSNVDYSGSGSTWGCHESYMHTADPGSLPAHLIPHLVSRVVYTGAGGFDNVSSGVRFTLSPRATHVHQVVSGESTNRRGIFHTKNEPLCAGGYNRLHVIFGESLCSDVATWLKVGTTALVVALCEMGLRPGVAVTLDTPVAAARLFASDPSCTAVTRTASGTLSAVAIQRHYLAQVEAQLGTGFFPAWAANVCRHWRRLLDRLEGGSEAVATTLDWAIKLALFREHARRRGLTWESLEKWTVLAERLSTVLGHTAFRGRKLRTTMLKGLTSQTWNEVEPERHRLGLAWDDFGRFLDVRDELFELDTRFGQLGEQGLFAALDRTGVLTHRIEGSGEVGKAIDHPPAAARARIRGQLVRQLSGDDDRYCADWTSVWDCHEDKYVDLSDPFETAMDWKKAENGRRGAGELPGFIQGLTRERRWERVMRARRHLEGLIDPQDPIALSECARQHRIRGELEAAERIFRQAIAVEDARVPPDSPKRPHRRNHLAMVLLRAGRLEEAARVNAEAWWLKARQHDLVSGRILFVRIALRFLGGDDDVRLYLGQLKTLLGLEPLECFANIATTWEIPDVLDALCERLPTEQATLMLHLTETLNDPAHGVVLDTLGPWRTAEAVALDVPWPGA